MEVIETAAAMRAWSRAHRAAGRRVGFVPTMGYLHYGHLSLVEAAMERSDVVVVGGCTHLLDTRSMPAVGNWCLCPCALLGLLHRSRVSDWLHGTEPYRLPPFFLDAF
jgi:hypothetical protein